MTYTNATTLVEFLRARYDEIAKMANDAGRRGHIAWAVTSLPSARWNDPMSDDVIICGGKPIVTVDSEYSGVATADHIAANDPAYVLADVEAKRRIVNRYEVVLEWLEQASGPSRRRDCGRQIADRRGRVTELEQVLHLLASAWSSHPDYDPSWRPAEVTA